MNSRLSMLANRLHDGLMTIIAHVLGAFDHRKKLDKIQVVQTYLERRIHFALADDAPHLLPLYEQYVKCEELEDRETDELFVHFTCIKEECVTLNEVIDGEGVKV